MVYLTPFTPFILGGKKIKILKRKKKKKKEEREEEEEEEEGHTQLPSGTFTTLGA